ncbi:MAG: lipid IV(A) 3-deoxy-D-manno-octulosonic acid transferase [Pseudomonadota bacterium]
MALFFQDFVYRLLQWLLLPFILLRLFWRGLKERGYWQHVSERFGLGTVPQTHAVWIHAVSVGEVRAAAPLIEHFLAQGKAVLVSCMTPAGRATAERLCGARAQVRYLPYDYSWAMRRFFRNARPACGIIMETELWPNLVREAKRAGVPLYLVNARLSEKSSAGYRRIAALTREMLQSFAAVAAQTEADAARLRQLGADKAMVAGNLKFDVELPPGQLDLGRHFKELAGPRPIWLAASTRAGEEKLILQAFKNAAPPEALLVLVPRHPQRFDEVAALVLGMELSLQRRSDGTPVGSTTRVWLGDSLGEMFAYYAAADCALIGGSLLPYGGQNLIEACAVGCPVLVGPHTENFQQATEDALAQGAALRVANAEAWVATAARLDGDATARQRMGDAGKRFTAAHKGAAERLVKMLAR